MLILTGNRFSRCFILELDGGGQGLNHTIKEASMFVPVPFEKEILSQYIPMKADGELDSCHRYSDRPQFSSPTNRSNDANVNKTNNPLLSCNGQFVYDTSIYQQSRVYDVG